MCTGIMMVSDELVRLSCGVFDGSVAQCFGMTPRKVRKASVRTGGMKESRQWQYLVLRCSSGFRSSAI